MAGKQARAALGSVVKDGPGVWRVRVTVGTDPQTGRRVNREKRVRGSRRDAEAQLARMLVVAGKSPTVATRMTLGDFFCDIYLPGARARLREDTVVGYERDARVHILPALGDVALADLDPAAVEAMLAAVDAPGARLSAYKTLRQALRVALRRGLVDRVVTDAVEPPKVPRYEPEVLDARQAAEVLAAFRGDPVEPAVLLALGCGLRRSEICGLDWADVDLAQRTVDVRDPVVCVGGVECRNGTKTPNSRRLVSIPPAFADRLAEIRPVGASGPLMPGADGHGRMRPDSVSARYDRVARAAGVRWTSLKNLRHSHATIMLEAGVDVVTVSRRLGHSSVSITDRFYLRPRRAKDAAAADAFDALGVLPATARK